MSDRIPDLYAILGVARDATPEQIRFAFRRRSKQCHPDAGGTHEQMIRLLQAYEILSEPVTRQEYDSCQRQQDATAWESACEQATRHAQATYQAHGQDWTELMGWLDRQSEQIQSSGRGRVASGAVTGLLLGAAVGAVCGSYFGIGRGMGIVIGVVCGAAGGAVQVSRPASSVPDP